MRDTPRQYQKEVLSMELVDVRYINQQGQTPTTHQRIETINTNEFIKTFTSIVAHDLFAQKLFSRN